MGEIIAVIMFEKSSLILLLLVFYGYTSKDLPCVYFI